MDRILLVLALLMAPTAGSDVTARCPASRGTSFNLSLSGRRNITGAWILSMRVMADEHERVDKRWSPRALAMDVGHGTVSCGGLESVQLTATAEVSAVFPPALRLDYELVEGFGYYKVHPTALAWKDARDMCVLEGAHLMIINSDAEADVYKTFFARKKDINNATNTGYAHLGFHDLVTEGQFLTVLGAPLSSSGYTRWSPSDPSGISTEDCGCANADALLFDVNCAWKCFFICEYGV